MTISNSNLDAMNTATSSAATPKAVHTSTVKISPRGEVSLEQSNGEEKFNGYVSRGMKKVIQDQLDSANRMLKQKDVKCEYRYVEEAKRIAIKVINTETDQVIKEIPSEDVLKMSQIIQEMTGTLIDERR